MGDCGARYISFLSQALPAQTVRIPLGETQALARIQLHHSAMAFLYVALLAEEGSAATWAAFLFVFGHGKVHRKQKPPGMMPAWNWLISVPLAA